MIQNNKKRKEAIPISPSLADNDIDLSEELVSPTLSKRVFYLSIQVVLNAIVIGCIAKLLVLLINFITNLSFYGILSVREASPAGHHLGLWVIVVPIVGGLLVGIMARVGSSAIRGHGIPEAMEQVLTNESRIKPIITLLKPLSAAISIGTGGPFGAEGPIISTGGAFGSLAGQIMHITPNERKILLTAGATAGMAAIFGTPIAAVLLAVELLLFEFSPRSIIPVALACATGAGMHLIFFDNAPAFPMAALPSPTYIALIWYVLLGGVIGVIATLISKSIYLIEDLFEKLPIHWMWWPAIGAVAIGVVGYFAPYTLGVGYNNITNLLTGNLPLQMILGLCVLKFVSWSVSLGSGTSGGTLAPLLTIGGATGILLGIVVLKYFPHSEINLPTCALIGMAAMFAGAARALLTSIIFAVEATMQPHGLLPLLGACTASYFVSFFLMKNTIMTEKIHRRGVITPHSYEPDMMQNRRVAEVMNAAVQAITITDSFAQVRQWISTHAVSGASLMVQDEAGALMGTVLLKDIYREQADVNAPIKDMVQRPLRYVYPETQLSFAIELMDRFHVELLPVVLKTNKQQVVGMLAPLEIFAAYRKHRYANEQYQRAISFKRNGYKLVLLGRHLLKK